MTLNLSIIYLNNKTEDGSKKGNKSFNGKLTGSSSLVFHTPVTCLCCITCFIFNNAGKAMQPAFVLESKILYMESM